MLILWTVGLQRLESCMHGDRPSAGQIVARLEHAARTARESAAQRTLNELSGMNPRIEPAHLLLVDEPVAGMTDAETVETARLLKDFGWYEGEAFRKWMRKLVNVKVEQVSKQYGVKSPGNSPRWTPATGACSSTSTPSRMRSRPCRRPSRP